TCFVSSLALVPGGVAAGGELVLADFEGAGVDAGWQTVNDNVMGGRSKGGPSFGDGVLRFSGATNTDGGGFSSIRTKPDSFDLTGKSGLLMRVRGDGRTYKAELRTDITMRDWAVPFRADFETEAGKWQELYVPLSDFSATFFGRQLDSAPVLDPAKVSSVGFMIYDKKDGEFALEVDWVKAVDQGVEEAPQTLVEVAVADGRFGTLATALTESGLLAALEGDGPFTVFAPTDAAFAKLPEGALENLLKAENRERLQSILKYHVSSGATLLAAALEAGSATPLEGEPVSIAFREGSVQVEGAALVNADIVCSNGVIHVIDSVLLPPEPANDIGSVAKKAGVFGTLLAAVEAAGLADTLAGAGPVTVLAPTDEAFAKLPDGTVENLLKKENRKQLQAVLAYHAIPGLVSAGDALNAGEAVTLNGASVEFGIVDGVLKANAATVQTADIAADNGVIHIIDRVLLPPSDEKSETEEEVVGKKMRPADRIVSAIERGVPMFNRGDAAECAAVYRECLADLCEDESVDAGLRKAVRRLMTQAKAADTDVERAWLYRGGLDHLYSAMSAH
ncbi:MAG: CIA30 family protein, partial [Verrucomicrobiales bacterium]|nr:CIA30 family protein [Verrucomicrobiales bacterium]